MPTPFVFLSIYIYLSTFPSVHLCVCASARLFIRHTFYYQPQLFLPVGTHITISLFRWFIRPAPAEPNKPKGTKSYLNVVQTDSYSLLQILRSIPPCPKSSS